MLFFYVYLKKIYHFFSSYWLCFQVRLSCGQENALLSSAEPSRCEYEMEFKTPSLCSQGNQAGHGKHTEL